MEADVKYKIIRDYKVTDAAVQDSNVFEVKSFGISRTEVKLELRNIAYSMEKFCFLMGQTAWKEVLRRKNK